MRRPCSLLDCVGQRLTRRCSLLLCAGKGLNRRCSLLHSTAQSHHVVAQSIESKLQHGFPHECGYSSVVSVATAAVTVAPVMSRSLPVTRKALSAWRTVVAVGKIGETAGGDPVAAGERIAMVDGSPSTVDGWR